MPWEIHIKQEKTRIHGFVHILSGLRCFVEFNMLQQELFNVFLEKCASGHKCCHFEVICHDVVI